MTKRTKRVTMIITVSAPVEFSAAEVRRDVRSRIKNEVGYYGDREHKSGRGYVEMAYGNVGVKPA